jgi:hypothetical protein
MMKEIVTIISLIFLMQGTILSAQAANGWKTDEDTLGQGVPKTACLSVVPDAGGMARKLDNEMAVR